MNEEDPPQASGDPVRVRGGYFFPAPAVHEEIRDEVTLSEIWNTLITRWKLVLGTGLFFGLASYGIAFTITPLFRAELLVAPGDYENQEAAKTGLSSPFGALASIAGIGTGGTSLSEAIATLKSRAITNSFVTEKNLLPVLFEERWDKDANRWKSSDPKRIPTLWDAYKVMDQVRTVTQDKKSGLIAVTVTWKDPQVAADWANELVLRTNLFMRSKTIARSNANISYLQDQLTRTSIIEIRASINTVVEQEIKKVMLAQGSEEYAFKVVDPALPPQEKDKPKRKNYGAGGLVFGLIIGIFAALFRGRRRT